MGFTMAIMLLAGGFGFGLDAFGFAPISAIAKLALCELAILVGVSHIAYCAGFERGQQRTKLPKTPGNDV